jgi:hypothetical protein
MFLVLTIWLLKRSGIFFPLLFAVHFQREDSSGILDGARKILCLKICHLSGWEEKFKIWKEKTKEMTD